MPKKEKKKKFNKITCPSRFSASHPPRADRGPSSADIRVTFHIRETLLTTASTFTSGNLPLSCSLLTRLCGSLGLTTHPLWAFFLSRPFSCPVSPPPPLFFYLPFPVLSRYSCFGVFPALPPLTFSSILPSPLSSFISSCR